MKGLLYQERRKYKVILNSRVMIDNVEKCSNLHKKYLHQVGTVRIVDKLTIKGATIVGITFGNDEALHQDHYHECKLKNIIPMKPHMVNFRKENLVSV